MYNTYYAPTYMYVHVYTIYVQICMCMFSSYIFTVSYKNDKKSKCVIEQQENESQKEHEPIEETNKTLMKENSAQVNAIPQKQDKRSNTRTADEKDKDKNQEINSQQDQPKHQDNELACHSNKDDHLEQENREDDDADQRKSHRDEDPPLVCSYKYRFDNSGLPGPRLN